MGMLVRHRLYCMEGIYLTAKGKHEGDGERRAK